MGVPAMPPPRRERPCPDIREPDQTQEEPPESPVKAPYAPEQRPKRPREGLGPSEGSEGLRTGVLGGGSN